MPIDDQLKMQILLGELDPRGQTRNRPRRRSPAGGALFIAGSLAIVIFLAVWAVL